ncbi:MAG: AMP-binding protein [Spirochaetales bacterium]|nr:AMP-binding protein [Spirochaetales bacterium]
MVNKEVYLSRPWLKFYTDDIPEEIEVPDVSVYDLFAQTALEFGSKTALVFYGKKIIYLKLQKLIDSFAGALIKMGIKKNDTIALYLLNSPQHVISYLAALKVGASVASINPHYTSRELASQFRDSKARILICETILFDNVIKSEIKPDITVLTNICENLPFFKRIIRKLAIRKTRIAVKRTVKAYRNQMNIYWFKKVILRRVPDMPRIPVEPRNDIACLSYSCGITGLPKASVLTHYNLVAAVIQLKNNWPVLDEGNEVVLSDFPLFSVYGQVSTMLFSLCSGFTLILYPAMDLEDIIFTIEKYQVTLFSGPPLLFRKLSVYEKTHYIDWTRLKLIISFADILYESIFDSWKDRTNTKIHEAYGMTETCGITHISPYKRSILGSFGLPLPDTTAAVWDTENNQFTPLNKIGEMIVKGPHIMKGYWNRPEETKKAFIEIDGEVWFRTGDMVRMDNEGYFYFYARECDRIPSGDYIVYTREVEETIYEYGPVKDAAIAGMKNSDGTFVIKAYVVLLPAAKGKISEEDIIEYCEDNMELAYKIPHMVEFRGDLPRIEFGKVRRSAFQTGSGETHE